MRSSVSAAWWDEGGPRGSHALPWRWRVLFCFLLQAQRKRGLVWTVGKTRPPLSTAVSMHLQLASLLQAEQAFESKMHAFGSRLHDIPIREIIQRKRLCCNKGLLYHVKETSARLLTNAPFNWSPVPRYRNVSDIALNCIVAPIITSKNSQPPALKIFKQKLCSTPLRNQNSV